MLLSHWLKLCNIAGWSRKARLVVQVHLLGWHLCLCRPWIGCSATFKARRPWTPCPRAPLTGTNSRTRRGSRTNWRTPPTWGKPLAAIFWKEWMILILIDCVYGAGIWQERTFWTGAMCDPSSRRETQELSPEPPLHRHPLVRDPCDSSMGVDDNADDQVIQVFVVIDKWGPTVAEFVVITMTQLTLQYGY